MGAYLSRPVTDKISEDEQNDRLAYGVSSMQGWRLKQEDAHNCILDFDVNTSLFGVYDGHGGFEVAKYTSKYFPDFLRCTKKYEQHSYKEALIEAFLGFDDTIPTPNVMAVLKEMVKADSGEFSEMKETSEVVVVRGTTSHAGCSSQYSDFDDDLETPETLRADASKPIEEVIASYCVPNISKLTSSESVKLVSPYLRGRREMMSKSCDETASRSNGNSISSKLMPSVSASCSSSNNDSAPKVEFYQDRCTSECIPGESINTDVEDGRVSGTVSPLNANVSEEVGSSGKHCKRVSIGNFSSNNTLCEMPGTSPKKRKLAFVDFDDSTTVKNFISHDEFAEDDSEDETFQPVDETLSSDDDDDDDEDFEHPLSKNSLAKQFLKRLNQVVREEGDDDDDDDDDDEDEDDEESEEENDEDEKENLDVSETANSKDLSGDSEEAEDGDEESLEEESDENCGDKDLSDVMEKPGIDSGCTAVVALLKGRDLYVANAGDSRCIVCKAGKAIDMSEDHKPEDKLEHNRIIKAGGLVSSDGRVNGGLNLSRAIGDHCYKKNADLPNTEQMITALPDVRTMELEPDVEFLVLACDGIWNSMNSQEVVDFVRPRIRSNMKLSSICEELFDKCLASDTWNDGTGCDNMTCIIVKLFHDENEVLSVEPNTCSKTNTVREGGDESKSVSNVVSDGSSIVLSNGAVLATGEAEGNNEQQSNGLIGDGTIKVQKRCAEEIITADGHKRQKTDGTTIELNLREGETS